MTFSEFKSKSPTQRYVEFKKKLTEKLIDKHFTGLSNRLNANPDKSDIRQLISLLIDFHLSDSLERPFVQVSTPNIRAEDRAMGFYEITKKHYQFAFGAQHTTNYHPGFFQYIASFFNKETGKIQRSLIHLDCSGCSLKEVAKLAKMESGIDTINERQLQNIIKRHF